MQSVLKPLAPQVSDSWFELYQDIARKLTIHSSQGWISHADYPDEPPSSEVLHCFEQLPPSLQHQFLSIELQNFLYETYYTGAWKQDSNSTIDESTQDLLINNTANGLNVDFFGALNRSNSGTGYFDPGWQISQQEPDGDLAVVKDGLTIHIDPKDHDLGDRCLFDQVAIRLPHNFIQDDYYVAVSDVGEICLQDNSIVNVFFNVESQVAFALMRYFTQALNPLKIPFTLKLLYLPDDYGRYDAGILSIAKNHLHRIWDLIQNFYLQHSSFFNADIPWMTKPLAPGLAIAEQPQDPTQPCFGLHRCKIIAESLLDAHASDDSVQGPVNKLVDRFSQLGLDLHRPYLNPGSGDIDADLVL
jgi:hypothetical protein